VSGQETVLCSACPPAVPRSEEPGHAGGVRGRRAAGGVPLGAERRGGRSLSLEAITQKRDVANMRSAASFLRQPRETSASSAGDDRAERGRDPALWRARFHEADARDPTGPHRGHYSFTHSCVGLLGTVLQEPGSSRAPGQLRRHENRMAHGRCIFMPGLPQNGDGAFPQSLTQFPPSPRAGTTSRRGLSDSAGPGCLDSIALMC
jgi:hypothetical protein